MPTNFHPTNHNNLRRAFWHNYREPRFYMLTLVTLNRRPLFGRVVGIPEPHVELSPFGQAVLTDELPKIPRFYPAIYVRHLVIMPDHLHIILRIKEELPEGKHLGNIVAGFKAGVNRLFRQMTGLADATVFEKGYNDRILSNADQLDRWNNYLDDNPRRLWLKRSRPELFTVLQDLDICGRKCQAVGNQFLLGIPDKVAIVVHRRYTDEDFQRLKTEWLACGERGGVIIGTSIAPREKEVMREAMNRGYRLIHLRDNGFPPLYKPSGEAFDACARGQLLQISPSLSCRKTAGHRTITRDQCLALNALAEAMVNS